MARPPRPGVPIPAPPDAEVDSTNPLRVRIDLQPPSFSGHSTHRLKRTELQGDVLVRGTTQIIAEAKNGNHLPRMIFDRPGMNLPHKDPKNPPKQPPSSSPNNPPKQNQESQLTRGKTYIYIVEYIKPEGNPGQQPGEPPKAPSTGEQTGQFPWLERSAIVQT